MNYRNLPNEDGAFMIESDEITDDYKIGIVVKHIKSGDCFEIIQRYFDGKHECIRTKPLFKQHYNQNFVVYLMTEYFTIEQEKEKTLFDK